MKYDTPPFPLSKIWVDMDENIPYPTTDVPSKGKKEKEKIKRLKNLELNLKKKIFGQENAIEIVCRLIKTHFAGLRDENKPIGVILFTGATGSGKTELSIQLSKQLQKRLIRLDMSEYQEKVSVTRLFGAAPGYAGHETGGKLVSLIQECPSSVLLLDEIEKAHPDVFSVFLQIFDYGCLTDSQGRKAFFNDVIIIMTSNIGAKNAGNKRIGFVEHVNENNINKDLEKLFTSEFRNRLDAIVPFNRLSPEIINQIVRKEIESLAIKLLIRKKIGLFFTENCLQTLATESYSNEFGAREVNRLIDKKIKSLLVDEILWGKLAHEGSSVYIDWRQDVGYYIDKFLEDMEKK